MRVAVAIVLLCGCLAVAAAEEPFVEFRICPKERFFADDTYYPYTVTTGRTIPLGAWVLRANDSPSPDPFASRRPGRRDILDPAAVRWSSDTPAFAAVDGNGVVTTRSVGEAGITGTDAEGHSHTIALKVVDPKDASVDLCVAFVERYVKDPKGREYRLSRYFGKLTEDSDGKLKSPDPLEPEQNYPAPGQIVVWRAHIINDGQRDSGPVTVIWKVDGAESERETIAGVPVAGMLVPTGRYADSDKKHPLLAHQGERTADFELKNEVRIDQPWRPARREVTVELVAPEGVVDDNPDNNKLTFCADAITLTCYFSETAYLGVSAVNRAMRKVNPEVQIALAAKDRAWKDELDIASTTGYDYVQRLVRIINKQLAASKYPLVPDGISERLRAEVRIVADLEQDNRNVRAAILSSDKDTDVADGDFWPAGGWYSRFTAPGTGMRDFGDCWFEPWVFREIGHARYLVPTYINSPVLLGRDIPIRDASGNPIYPDGSAVCVSSAMRATRYGGGADAGVWYDRLHWTEYEAYALERIAGRRARGSVGYDIEDPVAGAEYAEDTTNRHVIVVRDPSGMGLEGVTVEAIPVGYGSAGRVACMLKTDDHGRARLPAYPFASGPKRDSVSIKLHPTGIDPEDKVLIRLTYQQKTFYKWLTTYDANFAYWYAYGFRIDRWPYPNDPDCEPEGDWTRPKDTVSAYIYTIDPNWTPEEELAARDEVPRLGVEPDVRPGEFPGPE
jgi:hypothetical protein